MAHDFLSLGYSVDSNLAAVTVLSNEIPLIACIYLDKNENFNFFFINKKKERQEK